MSLVIAGDDIITSDYTTISISTENNITKYYDEDGKLHISYKQYDLEKKLEHCAIYADDTYADVNHKRVILDILKHGCIDYSPRPKYKDGTPAYTISINGVMHKYDLSKNQLPIITLRPIAVKSAIGELLWIYQDQSNDLDLLKEKYGVKWWDAWDIGDRTIGACYGETVRRHDLMNNLLEDIKKDPDGRRHIISLWQVEDFKDKHGLKPCCYQTNFNVRHAVDGDYLDMCLYQRSADYLVAHSVNLTQYSVFLCLVARHCGYKPGVFTWFGNNVQIYDRHILAAEELVSRKGIPCMPKIWINPDKTNFYDMTIDDIKIIDYPMKEIKEKNPQIKFELGE